MAALTGQTALITGAAQGIGRAIAEAFAGEGARLILLDLADTVHETARDLSAGSATVVAFQTDVTDPAAVQRAVAEAPKDGVDILVNNAGVVRLAPAEELTLADWDLTMNVNLRGPFIMAQAVAPGMIARRRSKIINLASQASLVALDQHVAYCASKAAIVGMTQVLALEWARFNVTVNAVAPTVVMTELGKKAWSGNKGKAMLEKIPLQRFATPEDVAAAAVFLASDGAAMITGQTLVVDGGTPSNERPTCSGPR